MTPTRAGLTIRRLSKSYDGHRALDSVDLELSPGSVHALLGQNGSGKSTLIKALAGVHKPDRGYHATLDGTPITLGSASVAHDHGLRFVHQDLGLIGSLSIIDNLALGRTYSRRWWLSDRHEARAAQRLLSDFGLHVDVDVPLNRLTASERTVVAIARALADGIPGGGVLVLDEPTATLPYRETHRLFTAVRRVRDQGTAVLYVTHRISEVFELADAVTVLRDGKVAATASVGEVSHGDLVEAIAGRPLDLLYPAPPPPRETIALSVRGMSGPSLDDVSFDLHNGEILGVAGLTGSGRDDLGKAIFGDGDATGSVQVAGRTITRRAPRVMIGAGVAYVPADRKKLSAIPTLTVRENLSLAAPGTPSLRWLGNRAGRRESAHWLDRFGVAPSNPDAGFSSLSGGNQQKVVLARWVRAAATVFLLDEPTQGVDIGGKKAIYDALIDAARSGAGILISSTDTEELAEVCDRVLVLATGRVVAEFDRAEATADRIVASQITEGAAP